MDSTLDQLTDALAARKLQAQQVQATLNRLAQEIGNLVGLPITPQTTTEEIVAAVKVRLDSKTQTYMPTSITADKRVHKRRA